MLDERTQVVHSNNPRQAALTGSFPRNSSGSDKMTLSIAIFTTHRDKHIERPYLRKKQNKKEKKNTRTLRSFFSFGVSFGLPFFLTFATADLDVSGAREASANVAVSIRPVAFIDSSSSFAEASVRACAAAAERASSDRYFYIYGQQMAAENNQNAPSLRFARMYDASVGACVVTSVCVCVNNNSSTRERIRIRLDALLTSGHSTVSAFMFMTKSQLAKASLNVSNDALSARSPSTLARRASASSASSASAGSRNPRPCGASVCAPERESAKSEPCETRRSGVRWGVGPGMGWLVHAARGQGCALPNVDLLTVITIWSRLDLSTIDNDLKH